MHAFRRVKSSTVAVALLGATAATSHGADLGGHWYLEKPAGVLASPFFEWSQAGDTFTLPTEISTCSGTTSGETLTISGGSCWQLDAQALAADTIVDGALTTPPMMLFSAKRFLAHRCECFDENDVDGDGCDAECRIEPCFTCTGDPSVCTPSGDGAACSDRLDCTTGETCTAGACGGGASVPGCIDVTGRWRILTTQQETTQLFSDLRDVEQRDGVVRMTRPSSGEIAEVGTIAPATGVMELGDGVAEGDPAWNLLLSRLNSAVPSCGIVSVDADVAADGATLEGTGQKPVRYAQRVGTSGYYGGLCTDPVSFTWSATKCTGDECDAVPNECNPCERPKAGGGCEIGPREGCLTSIEPHKSSFQFVDSNRPTGDKLRWKWKSGMSFDAGLLGDPTASTGMQVCVFDESAATPALLFSAYWDPRPAFDPEFDWETKEGQLRFRREIYAGKESVSWAPSSQDQSMLSIQGRGGDQGSFSLARGLADGIDLEQALFVPDNYVAADPIHAPLNLPVRVQATMDRGGACFESTFGAGGVKKNDDGVFSARSTQ